MDKSLLKKAAMQSVALMIAVITLSYALKHYQTITMAASSLFSEEPITSEVYEVPIDETILIDNNETEQAATVQEDSLIDVNNTPITNVEDLKSRIDNNILPLLSDNFIVIKKPQGETLTVQLEDIYINHSILLSISGISGDGLSDQMIFRASGDALFRGLPVYTEITTLKVDEENGTTEEVVIKDYGVDLIHGITINSGQGTTGSFTDQVLIELDSVYAYMIHEDANYYYIDLKKPSDVYDKIIVIDGGHGGKDAGAISKDGKHYEKDINLGIALQLKELLDQEDIKVYYTRTADDKVFLRPRVTLANSVDCDYFVSIHCNANEITSPNGTEVLYYDTEFKGVKSSALATLVSDELANTVDLKNKGIVQRHMEDIFIMDKSLVPTVLIEVGYMTNKKDLDYLLKTENQKEVAQGIYNALMKAFRELPTTE